MIIYSASQLETWSICIHERYLIDRQGQGVGSRLNCWSRAALSDESGPTADRVVLSGGYDTPVKHRDEGSQK